MLPVLVFLGGYPCDGQPADSLRAYYIQEYPDHFFIWPVLKQRSLTFDIQDKQENKRKVEFIPNNKFTLGAGFYVFDLGFEVTFAIPLAENSKSIYGESTGRDLQLNILSKKWGADIYYQKYNGFYINDSDNPVPKGQPYPQRSDLVTRNFGASGVYIFNHRKFSLRSSFTYAERQLRSKGSWLLYGTINSFKVTADSALLDPAVQDVVGTGSGFRSLRYTTVSVAPGYSYNLVWRKFFLNATVALGPAHHWINYEEESGPKRDDISINSTGIARFAVGYNSNRFFGGFGFSAQTRIVKFEEVRVSNSTNLFKLLVGYRFREFGILKKRVWDVNPLKF
ncbi:MAG: DUF4421 family protein [Flammeovirgaceae bacterium]|nr:MAG: DUF4421 family protein [Flammeovirgaceae bacterium]